MRESGRLEETEDSVDGTEVTSDKCQDAGDHDPSTDSLHTDTSEPEAKKAKLDACDASLLSDSVDLAKKTVTDNSVSMDSVARDTDTMVTDAKQQEQQLPNLDDKEGNDLSDHDAKTVVKAAQS